MDINFYMHAREEKNGKYFLTKLFTQVGKKKLKIKSVTRYFFFRLTSYTCINFQLQIRHI